MEITKLIPLDKFKSICEENLFKDNELGKILSDVEFWEGGETWTENNELWVGGDNGVQQISLDILIKHI